MRVLTLSEYTDISGGNLSSETKMIIALGSGLVGGITTATFMNAIGPFATFIGTPLTAITFGAVCTPFAPGIGTVGCGLAGGVIGYFVSSSFATVAGFMIGAGASSIFVYSQF